MACTMAGYQSQCQTPAARAKVLWVDWEETSLHGKSEYPRGRLPYFLEEGHPVQF